MKKVLVLFGIIIMIFGVASVAYASESISVTFVDTQRNAFPNKTITFEKDNYNRIILPKTFAETVSVSLPQSQKVDDETYYFDADWETNESSFAYSFTGWQIVGTAKKIPSVTTYHAGDYIDFDLLSEDPYTSNITQTTLTLQACWGKVVFIQNKYNKMIYNKYGIFEEEASAEYGTTIADDSNSGRKVTEPKDTVAQAYKLFSVEKTNYDAYENVLMLTGDLDYIKPNSTSSNQPNYNTKYSAATAYWGYLSSFGTVANNIRNATVKSLLTLPSVPLLKLKAYNWTTTCLGSLVFDNVNIKIAAQADFVNFNNTVLYLSSGFNIYDKNMYFATSNRCQNTANSGFTIYGAGYYTSLNGGYLGSLLLTSASGYATKTTYIVGENATVNSVYLGTTNGNFATDFATEMHYWGQGGKVNNFFGSSEAENHTTKKDRFITIKEQNVPNFYGGGAAASLYGDTHLKIYHCTMTNLYGGGRDYSANIYGDIYLDVEDCTITNIFCGGKNGNVMKVPEGAPYGTPGTGGNIYFNMKNSKVSGSIFGSGTGGSQTIWKSNYTTASVNSPYWTSDEWAKPFSDYPAYNPENDRITTYRYKSTSSGYRTSSVGVYKYIYWSYLSLATIENIEMNIDNCEVGGNVYGGGSIAVVNENTSINIKNGSVIRGTIYGGGDGVTVPGKVEVYYPLAEEGYTPPNVVVTEDHGGGLYTFTGKSEDSKARMNKYAEPFTWSNDESLKLTNGIDIERKLIYSPNTEGLGGVKGNTSVTIDGSQVLNSVYAGGNSGYVGGNTTLKVLNNSSVSGVIYAGGNNGDVRGNTSTEIDASTVGVLYGGGNKGKVLGNCDLNIKSGSLDTAFAGGHLGLVEGNTNVTVGSSANPFINITNILYGGGEGPGNDATYETVMGDATVLIEGLNTNVGSYGSALIGKVDGEVNVTFRDYWTGNSTNKYKVMNGIDRATNVYLENSHILLTNRDSNGNLEGIKDITNLYVPDGSGLKVSAAGELLGDFYGGGNFYLDSGVCLTVNGDVWGETHLVLNPVLVEEVSTILGTASNPYMRVRGEDHSNNYTAFYSNDSRYVIAHDFESSGAGIYFIQSDITINEKIENTVINKEGAIYIEDASLWSTDDVFIRNNNKFTSNIDGVLNFEVAVGETLYQDVTRSVSLVSRDSVVPFPKNTIITLFNNGALYTSKLDSSKNEVFLSELVDTENGNGNFAEETNIPQVATLVGYSELVGSTYEYSESFRIIVDFSQVEETDLLSTAPYNFMMNYYDNGTIIDNMQSIAKNIIRIEEKRPYTTELTTEYSYYETNSVLNITAKLSAPTDAINENIYGMPIYAVISLLDTSNHTAHLSDDVIIKVRDIEIEHNGASAKAKVANALDQNSFILQYNFTIDLSDVEVSDKLRKGEYIINVDYYAGTDEGTLIKKFANAKKSINVGDFDDYYLHLTVSKSGITQTGLIELTSSDNTRIVTVSYEGTLIDPYADIIVEKQSSNGLYVGCENYFLDNQITNLQNNQAVNLVYRGGASTGIYKVSFILKDRNHTEKSRESLLFKIK